MFTFADVAAAADDVVVETTPFGPVVVVTDGRVPLAWMRMSFPVGEYTIPEVGLPSDIVWRAVVLMPLADAEVEADLHPWMTPDACGIDAMFLVADRQAVAGQLRKILVEDYRELMVPNPYLRSEWRLQRDLPDRRLASAVADTFYRPGDPRRTAWEAPTGVLAGRTAAWLRDRVFGGPGATFGVAGALDATEARELVETVLQDVDPTPRPAPFRSALRPLIDAERRPTDVVVRADGRDQVVVAWARPGVGAADPSAAAAILADAVIRDQVEEILREVRGDAYGVETSGMVDVEPGAWLLATGTSPERVPGLVGAVESWFDGVVRDGLPTAAIEAARARLDLELRALAAPFDRMAVEMDHRLHQDRPGGWELREQALSVPAEEVDAFARAFCAPEGRARFRVLPPGVDDPLGR